jgi:hypothetical protein
VAANRNRKASVARMELVSEAGNVVAAKGAGPRSEQRRKKHGRARITNGRDVLPDVDGRSIIARRYKDIAQAIFIDQGGVELCSESHQQLIRRFAAAAVLAEQMESKLARGEEIDVQQHALLCSSLVRLSSRIGINRVPKNIVPSLDEYLSTNDADTEE